MTLTAIPALAFVWLTVLLQVPQASAQKVKLKYDKLTDTTSATSPTIHYGDDNIGHLFATMATDNGRPNVDVTAAVLFNGQANHDTITTVFLRFTIASMRQAVHTAAREEANAPANAPLRLLLDDTARVAFDAKLTDSDSRFGPLVDPKATTLVYIGAVPVATFDRIATAQHLEGSLYTARFSFKGKPLRELGAVRSVYEPAAATP